MVFLEKRLDLNQEMAFAAREMQEGRQKASKSFQSACSVLLKIADTVLGKLIPTYSTVTWGRFYLRLFKRVVVRSDKLGRGFRALISLSDQARQILGVLGAARDEGSQSHAQLPDLQCLLLSLIHI